VIPAPDGVIRHGAMVISIDEQWEATPSGRALQDLNSVRSRGEWREVETQVAVEMGNPAEIILDYCQKRQIDRIVMPVMFATTPQKLGTYGNVQYDLPKVGTCS
jgi:hypothetical protein